jgi:hypothetical protein
MIQAYRRTIREVLMVYESIIHKDFIANVNVSDKATFCISGKVSCHNCCTCETEKCHRKAGSMKEIPQN